EDPVRSDPKAAVAEPAHAVGVERPGQLRRVHDDEVVPAGLPFLEAHHAAASATPRGSVVVGSHHWMAGSFLNQVICRREYAMVSRTVRSTAVLSEISPRRWRAQCG